MFVNLQRSCSAPDLRENCLDVDENGNDNDPILNLILDPDAEVQGGVCKWARKKPMQANKELQIAPQSFSNHHNEADSYNGKDDKGENIRK